MTERGIAAWHSAWRPFLHAAAAVLVLACASAAARADDDLPGRVGRIADVAGQLSLAPGDRASDWAEVGINYPVTTGDNLWVGPEGRAEVDFGGGQFRLGGETNLHVSRLDDSQLALFLAQGRLIVRIRVLEPGDVAYIDAPNTQVQLTRPGLYRIEVTPDRQTTVVTVREGEALVMLARGAQQALPGQTVSISGADQVNADVRNGIGIDGLDAWSADRDRHYGRSRAAAYVSPQMVGYADLDNYGTWQTWPEYGPVWFPSAVGPDWAPYSDGYWTSVGAWGYTWIDFAPWGYAPSHYGRWAHIGGRWGWCPGSIVARPVWAPALVAWHGGPRWGLAGGDGSPVYGWVPLGWRDPYLPPWRGCSARCWTNLNQPYGVNVRERPRGPPASYANLGVPGAITAVPRSVLVGAQPVGGNRVRVSTQLAATAPVLGAAPPVPPGRVQAPVVRPAPGAPAPATAYTRNPGNRALEASIEARPPAPSPVPSAAAYPARPSPLPAPAGRPPATVTSMPEPGRAGEAPAARAEPRMAPQRAAPSVPPQAAPAPGYGGSAAAVPAPRVERNSAPAMTPSLQAQPQAAGAMSRPPAVLVPQAPAPLQGPQPAPVTGASPAARAAAATRDAPPGAGQAATPAPAGVPAPLAR